MWYFILVNNVDILGGGKHNSRDRLRGDLWQTQTQEQWMSALIGKWIIKSPLLMQSFIFGATSARQPLFFSFVDEKTEAQRVHSSITASMAEPWLEETWCWLVLQYAHYLLAKWNHTLNSLLVRLILHNTFSGLGFGEHGEQISGGDLKSWWLQFSVWLDVRKSNN